MNKVLVFFNVAETKTQFVNKSFIPEIIQISAIKVSKDLKTVDTFNKYVRPIKNPRLSQYCIAVTDVSQKDVDSAKSFSSVYSEFEAWVDTCPEEVSFVFWGKEPYKSLRRELDVSGLENRLRIEKYFNLQAYLQSKSEKKEQLELKAAFEMFGITYNQEATNVFFEVMNLMTLYINCIASSDVSRLWFEQKMKYIVDQLLECADYFTSSKDIFTVDIKPLIVLSNKCSAMLETADDLTTEEQELRLEQIRADIDVFERNLSDTILAHFRAESMQVQWAVIKGRLPQNFESVSDMCAFWEALTKKYAFFLKAKRGAYTIGFDAVRELHKSISNKLKVFKDSNIKILSA